MIVKISKKFASLIYFSFLCRKPICNEKIYYPVIRSDTTFVFCQTFKVIGYYANKPNGTIIAYLNDRGQKVVIKNHRFKIIGDIPSTTGMYINNLPVIWIEPTTQYVNINKDHVTVKGSKTQDESVIFDSLRKDIKTPERSAQLIRTFSSEHSSSIIPAYELYFPSNPQLSP